VAPLVTAPGPAPASPAYPPSPYEQPGATFAPERAVPGGGQPNTFVAPPNGMPLPAGGAAGQAPADTRPRLQPNFAPPTVQQRPTIQWPTAPPVGSGVNGSPATTVPRSYSPPVTAPRSYSPPGNSNGSNGIYPTPPASGSPTPAPSNGPAAQPVPDPEYPFNSNTSSPSPSPSTSLPSVPRLLNPTDRSASLSPRLMVPVSWPSRARGPRQPVSAGAVVQPPPSSQPLARPQRLDDTGWQSL
jgi:hypothetical protein